MPDIKLPDGRLIQGVPEGTTKEQLTSKLLSSGVLKGDEDWLKPSQPSQPQIGRGEAAFTTMTNPLGFGDEIKAGIAALTAKTFGGAATKDIDIGDLYREARDNERAKLAQAREKYPVQSFAGQMFSDVGAAGKLLKGAGLAGEGFRTAVKGGAALGASSALGETQNITDVSQVAKDVALGTVLGGVTGGAIQKAAPAAISAAGAISRAPKALLQKAVGITPKSQETLKAFENAGISPTLANVTEGNTTKTFQNLLGNFPGGRGEIEKATQRQVDDITKQIAGITRSEGGTIQETGKVIQEGAKNLKGALDTRIEQNYNNLDKYILSESQRQTNPKLLSAIDEWTKLKELESHLIGSVQGNAKIGALVNEDAAQKLGFWKNRAQAQGAKSLTLSADDAKNLNNIQKQIKSQESTISNFEKYMSPERFQSALMAGETKIPTNNLRNLTQDPQIQDIAAVGAGDTAKVLARYGQIVDEGGNISYPRLKIFRSTVGAKLQSPTLSGDERTALKKIYGGLSDDMKEAVVANGGEVGLQAFNKANKAFSRYQDVLESRINPLIEAKTPEAVYSMAMGGTKQGGSNIKGIMKTLDSEQQQFVRGTVAKRMGLASAGEQDATGEVFSPNKFLTEWNKLSPEARNNIFTKPQSAAIENLNKSISAIKDTSKARQSSNNLPYAAWIGLGSLSMANLPAGVAAVGGAKITAKMMTDPKFINWIAKAPQIKNAQIPAHLSQLSAIAAANSDIREEVLDYLQGITQEANAEEPSKSEDEIRQQLNEQKQKDPVLMQGIDINQESQKIKNRYYR